MQMSKRNKGKLEEEEDPEQHGRIIPNEMAIEILRRAPCEELTDNLKLVCKKWYSIICNWSFAYSHFERRMKKSASFSQLEAVYISATDGNQSVTFSSLELHNVNTKRFQRLKASRCLYTKKHVMGKDFPNYDMRFKHANPVNGFVCFWSSNGGHFHVCNPMTREYFTTTPNPYWDHPRGYGIIGLGFCPITYRYKVVVFQGHENANMMVEIKVSVLTVGTDHSWRPLKWNYDDNSIYSRSATYVNGALYVLWCKETDETTTTKRLVIFDVAKEEFDMIEVPIESHIDEYFVSIEDKGDGKLCLMTKTQSLDDDCYILFKGYVAHVNDDLGNLNSWRLQYSVAVPDIYSGIRTSVYHMSFTDEILILEGSSMLGFIDVASGSMIGDFYLSNRTMAILYVPSILPLRHRSVKEKFYLH